MFSPSACLIALFSLSVAAVTARGEAPDTRCFELRTYHAAPGKLEALEKRFRDHTCALFAKHGMTNVGYWEPLENTDNLLIYVLAYPSREARDADWKAFQADPDWVAAKTESEKEGKLVNKVDSMFLQATDFSPALAAGGAAADAAPRVFELRTYTTTPGNLPLLLKRFREHTVSLFTKHGMTNVVYWTPQAGQPQAENTLVYLLAHKSKEAGEASFKAFRADPDWVAAKEASEKAGGGSLTVPDGVKSVYMKAMDFSPLK